MSIIPRNATIRSTMLGVEDHGIMTFMLDLDYGSSGQGAGGYALDGKPRTPSGERRGVEGSIVLIRKILEIVGVEKWEDLPGKHIRVWQDNSNVYAIGHITKDNCLNFQEFFDAYKNV